MVGSEPWLLQSYYLKFPVELLNLYQASVIKGNAGELAALAGSLEVEYIFLSPRWYP
jgi:hypothetical protein